MRFSPYSYEIENESQSGYVVLANADGNIQISDVGYMDMGQILWGDNTLFFGGPQEEYRLLETGLTNTPRNISETTESARFLIQNNKGFVSIYNGGQSDDGYLSQVVAYENGKQMDWTVSGFFDSSVAQCGDKIVGLTSIENLNAEIRKSVEKEDYTDALIQLYPRPQNASETVMTVVNAGDKYEYLYGMESIPCIDGKMFVLA